MRIKIIALILGLLALTVSAVAQNNKAAVREFKKVFKTYPFSDPNPIPTMGKIYPYFRYDGFTDKPVNKEWKVIELENDYIKVMIMPEIGGKIWTAIEKSTGKAFIYNNEVVKFRDVAMRGPWTSGGIEANYGIIGHTPAVATPVDYLTRENPDGSVSCFIGVLDLLTRSPWRLEINLPKDKAYFTTTSSWYNATAIEQPYYTWMNVGLKAKGNLQFIYPGTHYLGHDGEAAEWPVNKENGKDISYYENNNFGGYKSYHVFGKYADFFGAYWHDEDFGMGRYSSHDDKAGKKIWIWGLSQQGMIWEKLLTDNNGQYVEVQSGRLFNQAAERSTFTPFKHRGFAPYQSDTWTEYWFPVKGTKGFVKANQYGSLNVTEEHAEVTVYFSALQPINDKLVVYDGETQIFEKQIVLKPMETFSAPLLLKVNAKDLRVTIGGNKLEYFSRPEAETLARPLEMPKNFDWNSAYGLWMQGKENLRQRFYSEAKIKLEACLQKDSNYAPALVDLALIEYRNLEYEKSLAYAKKALSVDTYDPAANYYYGLANLQLGKITDAKDGFDLAAQSAEYRSAAYTELAKIAFRTKDQLTASTFLQKDFLAAPANRDAALLRALLTRKVKEDYTVSFDFGLKFDLLNHFKNAEDYLATRDTKNKAIFLSNIKSELPDETLLEITAWYESLSLFSDAEKILQLAGNSPESLYWLAYLDYKQQGKNYKNLIQKANNASPNLVFPFRAETARILQWVLTNDKAWQPKYYLGLIYWSRANFAKASELFAACGDEPDYAPFYAARAELRKKSSREKSFADLARAAQLDPKQWRLGKLIAERHIEDKQYSQALQVAKKYSEQFPENYQLGMLLAKSLLLNNQYQDCSDLLAKLNILPYEGATDGRRMYRETQLMLAIEKMRAKDYNAAQKFITAAKLWPENLGAGKPYQEDIDERLEDWLAATCYEKIGKSAESASALQRIIATRHYPRSIGELIYALALKKKGEPALAAQKFSEWKKTAPKDWLEFADQIMAGAPVVIADAAISDETIRVLGAFSLLK